MIVRFSTAARARGELILAAVVVASITVAIASGSFFDRDDLFFAEYFQINPPTPDVLVRSWFGHLMPGYIASVIVFLKLFGLSWPVALTLTALIHTGAFVALVRCLDEVVGAVRLNLLAGLAFSLSLGPIMVRLWWAATLNNMLALALGLAVLGCATRWVTRRRTRHLIAALLLYAVALTMSEKNLLFSLHILAWCFLVVWRGRPIRTRFGDVLRTWPLWAGIGILSLIDVVAFLSGPYVAESGSSPSAATSVDFMVHNIFGALVPSLFGVDMVDQTTSLLDLRVVIACGLVAAFVVWSVVRDRSTASVWVFALVAATANAAVLSRRADLVGVAAGRQLRYLLESSALVWLAIGVVAVAVLTARRGVPAPRRARRPSARRRTIGSVVGAVAVVVIVFSVWSWTGGVARAIASSGGHAAREWVDELTSTLPRSSPAPLIDSPLPATFAIPQLHPYDMVAPLLPSLGWDDVRTTNVIEGAWVVGQDGHAGPAVLASPDAQFSGERCTDGNSFVPLPEVKTTGRTFLVLDYSRSTADTVTFQFEGGWTTIDKPAGSGRVAVYLSNAIDADLTINPQGGSLCVDALTVADIRPAEA